MKMIRIIFVIGAVVCAALCIVTSLYHEAGSETIEFSSDSGEIFSDSKSYYMVFTGDNADTVTWNFGDGTSAEAFEVYKTYETEGDYQIICRSVNDNGERYSAYVLHIQDSDYGILDGYVTQLILLFVAVAMMVCSRFFAEGDKE